MLKKYISILFVIIGISKAQFLEADVSLDLRNINKNYHFLHENLKEEISSYYEGTIFSEDDLDLGITIKMHIVVQSIHRTNNVETINARFFISNNLDLNQYSKSSTFPYYRGQSITPSSNFDPLSSLLDYFAFIFLANEIDMYSPLEGTTFYNLAEKISIRGKESNYSNGWDDRWKKCKRIIENPHLRKFRFHWYELRYNMLETQIPLDEKRKLATELENNIYYLKEFYPNDRNTFLFLNIYCEEIGKILGELRMFDALIMLSNYDVDNKSIYNKNLK